MALNFDLKKTWSDLSIRKEDTKWLLLIILLTTALSIIDIFSNVKIFNLIGSLILSAYFILMMNNIVKGNEYPLSNIINSNDENRNLLLVAVRLLGLGVVYGLGIVLLIGLMFWIFVGLLKLSVIQGLIILMLILLPISPFLPIINMLYAENLNFSDAFNLKKGWKSIKVAYKEYLACFALYFLILIALIASVILVGVAVGTIIAIVCILLKMGNPMNIFHDPSKHVSDMISTIIGGVVGGFIAYFYSHIFAQAYKYSLTKIDEIQN